MSAPREPWWVANDRAYLQQMRNAIEGKDDNESVFYVGDQRGLELVSSVRAKIRGLEQRIANDIARFQAAGGDYEKM